MINHIREISKNTEMTFFLASDSIPHEFTVVLGDSIVEFSPRTLSPLESIKLEDLYSNQSFDYRACG